MPKLLLTSVFFFTLLIGYSQTLTKEEKKLYTLLMAYRKGKGLPPIALSKSLTLVAQTHAKDLAINKPDIEDCNPHSWSDKGSWTACCYTPDHAAGECMWQKPSELTSYPGSGYEIVCGSNACCLDFVMTATYALQSWKGSSGHNEVIINAGMWKDRWQAIGIGIYKGFAVVWFGNEPDTN